MIAGIAGLIAAALLVGTPVQKTAAVAGEVGASAIVSASHHQGPLLRSDARGAGGR